MAHIQIIIGSTRPGRVAKKITDWYMEKLVLPADSTIELVDLQDVNLPFLDEAMPASMGQYQNDHTKKFAEIIAKADGYIWVTPEYNHAPSPVLLNAISFLKNEWQYKPVAFVGYGVVGAARAIEHLVSVASELQMVPLRERVWVNEPWANVTEAGEVTDFRGEPTGQVAELVRWANATKSLRS